MKKGDLEFYKNETISFYDIDTAFYDYIEGYSEQDIINLFTEEMKKQILNESPSYYVKDEKAYFNQFFQELEPEEVKEVIKEYEKEER